MANEPMPGVQGGHSIVKPAVEEPKAQPAGEDGSFMVGNTRVKISGSVTIDIGAGNTRPPRK